MEIYTQESTELFYLTILWNYLENNGFLIYTISSFNRINVLNKKEKNLIEVTGYTNNVENSQHQDGIKNNLIKNKELFIKELKDEYKRVKYWKINGLPDINKLVINFYINLSEEQKKYFPPLLKKIYFQMDNIKTKNNFFTIMNLFLNNLSLSQFQSLWSLLPTNIIKITKYSKILDSILHFIKTKIPKKSQHDFLHSFLCSRSKMLIRSEQKSLEIRDLLIKEYMHDKDLLDDYKDFFPSLELYLKSKSNSNYLEERFIQESFYMEINFDKMKAILAIPNWNNERYQSWINLLLNKLFKEHEEINSIKNFTEKDRYRRQEYLSIHVTKHIKVGVSKVDIEAYIISFFKNLSRDYNNIGYSINERNNYIDKWYKMESLNKSLAKKDLIKTIKKI